jgi:hypothetical protein
MTTLDSRSDTVSTDPETRAVTEAVEAFLASNDPTSMDNVAFRGTSPRGTAGSECGPN